VTTPSGLKYVDREVGDGEEAKAGDLVVVHYTGKLRNGKKFDSSYDRDEPFPFRLGAGKVLKGWEEGVAGMKEGGRRKLVIPPDLGYGERGSPPEIPPSSELHFEVELLRIVRLKITDLVEGKGDPAKAGNTVEVHYTGTLKDGKKFDSSLDRGEPIEFELGAGEVIKGWDQGVAGMRVGGKRKLVIPPELGYGKKGKGAIPGNAELHFEIELLKIR
jgi:peptidylprolyl isomerase